MKNDNTLLLSLKKAYVDGRKEFDAMTAFVKAYADDQETKIAIDAKSKMARIKYDNDCLKKAIDELDINDRFERLVS